jgi:NCAIR mutase (PurE)-related protein
MWLKGLAAVAIGGAATGVANAIGYGQLNKNVAVTAGVGALSTVVAYLIKSPVVAPPAGEQEQCSPASPETDR